MLKGFELCWWNVQMHVIYDQWISVLLDERFYRAWQWRTMARIRQKSLNQYKSTGNNMQRSYSKHVKNQPWNLYQLPNLMKICNIKDKVFKQKMILVSDWIKWITLNFFLQLKIIPLNNDTILQKPRWCSNNRFHYSCAMRSTWNND